MADFITIRRIQNGDDQAFALLYDRMAEPALRFAAAIVGHDGLAADAVQEAFLRVYRAIGRFKADRPFEPWFHRILVNECRRALRWRGRLVPSESIPEQADGSQDHIALYDAIGALDRKLREPLVLKYLAGYREDEVAAILGVSVTTAKGRLKRARLHLRKQLEGGG